MSSSETKVRIRTTNLIPDLAYEIVLLLRKACTDSCVFTIPQLPVTVNHMYKHTRFGTRLSQETKDFRDVVALCMGPLKTTWKPNNPIAAVILLESPHWITKKRTVRKSDCDNRVKPLLDAIQLSTGMKDELCWQLHVFKIASKVERTRVYLFEMNDVVDYLTEGG